ncbi:hypothetical protein F9C07_5448 [Aspergillus flavus]|uniref:Uncharacterized protein n=1 Tax=Aspergillus flavus (strain ATCC 200026 / FGSC A1120 / IAM 13836 / NRRL 3357 / JCM 12722 / SRRC 167) TaxID=332952 RepID=A0A7U2MWZ4_ASPFN|nr:hypothetical protein AFLA_007684 [Aspergillus flavus NRRL3357]QRD91402.1 hypothetical protein F9C07_5448 [Aspergillus flavus]UDD64092.1 hypothetical protein AFCA_011338 [Aspergillus flavus]
MSSNLQNNTQANQEAALQNLEGTDSKPKTIKSEDRAALNEALTDQATMMLLSTAGRSSQQERERKRADAEARSRANGGL